MHPRTTRTYLACMTGGTGLARLAAPTSADREWLSYTNVTESRPLRRHSACTLQQNSPRITAGQSGKFDQHAPARIPSRSPRYTPVRTRSHQALLSKYQRTVLVSPLSKLSCGRQPISCAIFEGLIA